MLAESCAALSVAVRVGTGTQALRGCWADRIATPESLTRGHT